MFHFIGLGVVLSLTLPLAAGQQSQPATRAAGLHPRVKLETSLGDIIVELDAERAPITVDNFLQYVESGFYNGTVFHRVLRDFVIQGGGYDAELNARKDGLRAPIRNEWRNGLKNRRGTIAMARRGWSPRMAAELKKETANSATAQFYINVTDNPRLDRPQADGAAYCVFGRVVAGMDVVDRIRNAEVSVHPKLSPTSKSVPVEPIVIRSAVLLDEFDRAQLAERIKASEQRIARYEADPGLWECELIDEWIRKAEAESGSRVQTTASGLRYVVLRAGSGPQPQASDTVRVHYSGWLVYGDKFDSSYDRGEPAEFPLNRVIRGWTEGVGLMKVGGKCRLIIPPELGYGRRGRPPKIPPNATLIFDVELLEIR